MLLTETAYAKINLALHVRRRRTDDYHELETLFAFCADGDVLTAEAADEIALTIEGPFADGLAVDEGNLVIRAAKALQKTVGVKTGARLHLTKNLPIASGIGGGSADAAAALRLLHQLWQPGLTANEILNSAGCFDPVQPLGADIPACWSSVTARGEGVGEVLTPLGDALAGMPVMLVNPRVAVSTGAIFKTWDGVDRGPLAQGDNTLEIAQSARNDLMAPAIVLAPVIAEVLEALQTQSGATLVRMSGSGATCFALFESIVARDAAHAAIADAHPDWWTMVSRLR